MAYVGGVVDKTQLLRLLHVGQSDDSPLLEQSILYYFGYFGSLRLSALAYISETGARAVAVMSCLIAPLLTVTLPSTAAKMSRLL